MIIPLGAQLLKEQEIDPGSKLFNYLSKLALQPYRLTKRPTTHLHLAIASGRASLEHECVCEL